MYERITILALAVAALSLITAGIVCFCCRNIYFNRQKAFNLSHFFYIH